jgi:RNA polymerase sigma-70 factor (ECF subfamily)
MPQAEAGAAEQELRAGLRAQLADLRAFARFLVRDPHAADDLVQETVLRALRASTQFAPGSSLRAWLFTILRRAFYEQARRRRREAAALSEQASTRRGEAAEVSGADVADLQALLWRLPASQREALVLVAAQGLTHEEAAAICGVPVGTMRARLSRARAALARGQPEDPPV